MRSGYTKAFAPLSRAHLLHRLGTVGTAEVCFSHVANVCSCPVALCLSSSPLLFLQPPLNHKHTLTCYTCFLGDARYSFHPCLCKPSLVVVMEFPASHRGTQKRSVIRFFPSRDIWFQVQISTLKRKILYKCSDIAADAPMADRLPATFCFFLMRTPATLHTLC